LKNKGQDILHSLKKLTATALLLTITAFSAKAAVPMIKPVLIKTAKLASAFMVPEIAMEEIWQQLKGTPEEMSKEETEQPKNIGEPVAEPVAIPKKEETHNNDKDNETDIEDNISDITLQESDPMPDIPDNYKGTILTENMSDVEGRLAIKIDNFRLRNYTALPSAEIKEILKTPFSITLENTTEPQVLIYHTHATESYCPYDGDSYDTRYNWRSTDNNNNMVTVGAVIAQELRKNGISVIHDTMQHDYPSYNGSYANSYRSIKDNLDHYPTIKVILDVHRDAIEREAGLIVKPAVDYQGERYAQLMLVSNCDDGSGLLPNWKENLRFAAAFSKELEDMVPEITRPILFSYRKYNQQLSSGALLLEFGSHANTMAEVQRTARVAAKALAKTLKGTVEGS